MVSRKKRSIEDRLLAAQVAIENARADATIRAALAPFAYDEARLAAGRALYDAAQALVNQQKAVYGDQYGSTGAVNAARTTADTAYRRTLAVARVALKGHVQAHAALMLDGERQQSLAGWLEQAQAFYGNLLAAPDLLAALGSFGYDRAKLEAERALVEAVAAANLAQEQQKGNAQQTTQQRDAALDALDTWVADFQVIARVALADQPQQLEKLGFGAVP